MRSAMAWLVGTVLLLPVRGFACPCVDTEVVRVDEANRRLVATISESSRLMVTAALYELLIDEIQPDHGEWLADWRVTFFTTRQAAEQGGPPDTHVADYDRAEQKLTLWPRLEPQREEVDLTVR